MFRFKVVFPPFALAQSWRTAKIDDRVVLLLLLTPTPAETTADIMANGAAMFV